MSLLATILAPETSWMCLILRPWRPMTVPMRLCEMRRRTEVREPVAGAAVGEEGAASDDEAGGEEMATTGFSRIV